MGNGNGNGKKGTITGCSRARQGKAWHHDINISGTWLLILVFLGVFVFLFNNLAFLCCANEMSGVGGDLGLFFFPFGICMHLIPLCYILEVQVHESREEKRKLHI